MTKTPLPPEAKVEAEAEAETKAKAPSRKRGALRAYKSAEDRRAGIVAAALKCIQEVGYARLTARKIAETSGISLGHITYNFKDMNEVLVETYRHASRLLYEATEQSLSAAAPSPSDRLHAYLRAGFSPAVLRRDYIRLRVDLWSAAVANPEIAATEIALYQRYRDALSGIITELARERGLGPDPVPRLVDTIMAVLDGLWLDWERRQSPEAIENGLAGCMELVNALLPPKS